ncbi:5'-nucleotidase C-terminal domain-containing protein [Flavobacterium sp.]|uniref:5'-nucleotidase C-terminal domain-containing protein n=1 Tax=Flavobacterium sp. TaxID=239 RepID=UPI003752D4A4
MVNLKNYNVVLKHFVLLLTFFIVVSCGQQKYNVSKIEGKKIGISNSQSESTEIENYIKPYREHIDKDLSTILAYSPETLDKSKGEWQTNIGSFLADITLEKSNPIFESREKKAIDICLLNHGGIRTIIPKGSVTARNAYEVMPFENSATVIALKGEQILELINYIISEKKPHPLSGLTFTITKENTAKNITIQGKQIENTKIYYVVTNDYLANGGDNMVFFKKGIQRTDLDYKLRTIIIDYFKDVDTLKINNNVRISKE